MSVGGSTRRTFLSIAASAAAVQPGLSRITAAAVKADRVNVGIIGVGTRGYQLHREICNSTHVRVGGIADLSDHYIERIRPELADSKTPILRDYRALLDDKSIDAVIIATPDHWHSRMASDALDAGKDVYLEKPLAWSFSEAVQLRDKAAASNRVTQVGYHRRSMGLLEQAREVIKSGAMGNISHVQLWSSRNRALAPWRTYNDYATPGLPEKSGLEHVNWQQYQSNRPPRAYDPRRYFHWQCYEEYSTGIFGILMSHFLDAANVVLDLPIPTSCSATGGIFAYDDGRTLPDTCSALFTYPSRRLSISFVGMSNNSFFDQEAEFRGTQGTMTFHASGARIYAEGKNDLFQKFASKERSQRQDFRTQPVHELRPHRVSPTLAHLDDFFVAVKQRGRTRCPIDEAFKAMVGVAMAQESYKSQRVARWDAEQMTLKV